MDQITEGLRTHVERRGTSEIRDGMAIDWDVPITVDDGLVLRADVYRPIAAGRYPVILSYGPYAKWLLFKDGYSTAWEIMVREHPDVPAGSTNAYQSWEWSIRRSGFGRIRDRARRFRGAGRSPGYIDPFSPRETLDIYHCIEWAALQPWSTGKIGMAGISTTPSTNGRWRRCSHRISPRSASGKAPATGTATRTTTAASSARSRATGMTCRSRPCSTVLAPADR